MPRHIVRVALLATLLFTAACEQAPAPVEMLGQNTYGHDGVIYAGSGQSAHVAGYTTGGMSVIADAAPAAPISSHDLAPPQAATPIAALRPASGTPMVQASAETDNSINPWTGRPHFSTPATTPVASATPVMQRKGVAWPARIAQSSKKHVSETKTADSRFMWPVDSHRIISTFGPKGHGLVNDGINIAADDGEPVWASAGGEIVYVGNELAGYGNMVLIRHHGDKTTAYAHLGRITVDKYQQVKQGDIIGYVGSTGNVRVPQLHFAIREGNAPVDPTRYLSSKVAGL